MSTEDLVKERARRLEAARLHHGLPDAVSGAAFLTKALGRKISKDTYTQHENGTRGMTRAVDDYAEGYGVSASWLLYGDSAPDWYRDDRPQAAPKPLNLVELKKYIESKNIPAPMSKSPGRLRAVAREIPVMGEVAAGLWKEASSREVWQATEHIRLDVQGYESASLYAMRVVGNSMNLVFPPGRYVIVAPAAEAGVRVGDYVIVERQMANLVEVTVKQLGSEGGRPVLLPRSSDPDFQQPIHLAGDKADQSRPRIIGVVVAEYARTERPPAGQMLELPEEYAE